MSFPMCFLFSSKSSSKSWWHIFLKTEIFLLDKKKDMFSIPILPSSSAWKSQNSNVSKAIINHMYFHGWSMFSFFVFKSGDGGPLIYTKMYHVLYWWFSHSNIPLQSGECSWDFQGIVFKQASQVTDTIPLDDKLDKCPKLSVRSQGAVSGKVLDLGPAVKGPRTSCN